MKKYLFVINPVSGGTDKSALKRKILSRSNDSNDFEFYFTKGENDQEAVKEKLEKFSPEAMVVAGGDGTITEISGCISGTPVALGILPTGSANGLATALGIDMDNALEIIFQNHTQQLDVINVNGHRMLHMADIGLNASLIRRYEVEERRGFLGYAISALQELPALSENFEVTINDSTWETNFLIIANARQYGTGYVVNPKGQLDDQLVELCVLKEISTEAIINSIFFDEEDQQNQLFEIIKGAAFTIKANKPVDFQVDGEYLNKVREVIVKVLPDQLKVLMPKKRA